MTGIDRDSLFYKELVRAAREEVVQQLKVERQGGNGSNGARWWGRWASTAVWILGTTAAIFLSWATMNTEIAVLKTQMGAVQVQLQKFDDKLDRILGQRTP